MSHSQFFSELGSRSRARDPYVQLLQWLEGTTLKDLNAKLQEAESLFMRAGITFSVASGELDTERLIPFDIIPRVFTNSEWTRLEAGIKQRAIAINAFLWDVYHRGEIIEAGIVPAREVYQNSAFDMQVIGISPSQRVFSHIIGVDLVRTGEDEFFVLEDNCRTPSGVSYMMENREIMMRLFPQLFRDNRVLPVADYPSRLRQVLRDVAPRLCDNDPCVVVLTPGQFNSAYFEHAFLADQMGVELVEGRDLFVNGNFVYMRTTEGPKRVDVIYRRIDDEFIDPLAYRPDSILGVPGLLNAYRAGGVQLVSAPGSGVADDKAIYTYVPDMIRFYLGEEPILKNVQTWRCSDPDDLKYVLENLGELVVKEVHGSGGYGMLIGPKSTKQEIEDYRQRILASPAEFIAQPTLALSTVPAYQDEGLVERHVDLRPFCLVGKSLELCPGGLTRVALREGSLVVNSSQGGGVKDTWVLAS